MNSVDDTVIRHEVWFLEVPRVGDTVMLFIGSFEVVRVYWAEAESTPHGVVGGSPILAVKPGDVEDDAKSTGEISDGYHTFDELYDHRTALFAALCRTSGTSWRSREHAPGQGAMYEGMFIAGMDTPAGPITYHVEDRHWDLFDGVPTLPNAPVWDGHTPADVIDRLRSVHVERA